MNNRFTQMNQSAATKKNMSSCLLLKIDSNDLPNDTTISFRDGKIVLRDSIGNSAEFEANELTILHSKTVVVNSAAYIITAPNVDCLAGKRYYIRDGQLHSEDLPEESDSEDTDRVNINDSDASDSSDVDDLSDESDSD
ncbi:hypothetical protein F-VV10_0384 [Faustovirus]|nr:hypothetical protein F-VV10_0384 [Faustovirus]